MPVPDRRYFLRIAALKIATIAGFAAVQGCGTILHPERKGQPAGRIDWKIFAFNAVGLVLFFIPGVIAFAVDFNNGTIYLPPGETQAGLKNFTGDTQLTAVSVSRKQLTPQQIEKVVSSHCGQTINLHEDNVQTEPLTSLGHFRAAQRRLFRTDRTSGNTAKS